MMKASIIGFIAIGATLLGCSGGSAGDVEAANKASAQAPKSVDQLPEEMSPEAKRMAGAAMGQQQAMSDHAMRENEARKRAAQGR